MKRVLVMKTFFALMVLFAVQMSVSAQVAELEAVPGSPDQIQEMMLLKFESCDYEGKKEFILTCLPEFTKILESIEARSLNDAKAFVEEIAPQIRRYLKASSEFKLSTQRIEQSNLTFKEAVADQRKSNKDALEILKKTETLQNLFKDSFVTLMLWFLVLVVIFALSGFLACYALVLRIAPNWVIFRKLRNVQLKLAGFKAANQEEWNNIQEVLGLAMGHLKHASLYLNEVSENANSGRSLKSICKATHLVIGFLGKFGVKTVDPESSLLSKAGIAISQSSEKLLQAEMALQAREVTLEQTIEQRVASLRVEDAKTLAEIASTKSENEKLKIELAQMELDLRAREVRLANDRQVVEQMLTDANRLNEEGQNMLLSVAGLPGREEVAA
jgi:hypothetical protein